MTHENIFCLVFAGFMALVVLVALIVAIYMSISEKLQKRKFYKKLDKHPEMRKLWDEMWLCDKEWYRANGDVDATRAEIDELCDPYHTKYLTKEDATENDIALEELRVMLKNYLTIENGARFKYELAKDEFLYYCDEKGIKVPDCIDLI